MKTMRSKLALLLASVMAGIMVFTGCTTSNFAPPTALNILIIDRLTVEQLQNAYINDSAAANNLYSGKRFNFGMVRAEQVVNSYFAVKDNEDYVLSGKVLFKPRQTKDIKGIIQGTIFEVIGEVQGYTAGKIIVSECWFNIISGGRSSVPSGGLY